MSKKDDFKQQIYGNPNWIDGRINRLEYFWRTFLTALSFGVALWGTIILYLMNQKIFAGFVGAFALWCYWRIIMAYVKRLHDLGWSGWLVLFLIFDGLERTLIDVPMLSILISAFTFVLSLILLFKKGDKGVNKYGKDPLLKYEDNQ